MLKMFLAASLAAAACMLAQTALAQTPEQTRPSAEALALQAHVSPDDIAADAQVVENCLKTANDRLAMAACAARVAKPCYGDEDFASTTFGQWNCARRLRAAWAPALAAARAAWAHDLSSNTVTGEPAAGGTQESGDFERAEAVWEDWRNQWCSLMESQFGGGTYAKVELADCFAQTDIDHTIDLKLFGPAY